MTASKNVKACIAGRMGDDTESMTDEEYDTIIASIEGRIERGDRVEDVLERAQRALREQKALERRAAIITVLRRKELVQKVAAFSLGKGSAFTEGVNSLGKRNKQGAPTGDVMKDVIGQLTAEGYEAFLGSSNRRSPFARASVDAGRRGWGNRLVSSFVRDLHASEAYKGFLGKRFMGVNYGEGYLDREIAREIYELSAKGGTPGITKNKMAMDAAAIAVKHMKQARIDQNLVGAWIKDLPGFIASQSHSARKLQKMGYDKWREFILARGTDGKVRLDIERTFYDPLGKPPTPTQIEEALRRVFDDLSSGNVAKDLPVGNVAVTGMGSNLARRASEHRVLHWSGADAFIDYNREFGHASLFEALIATLERSATVGSLLETMGPNPQAMHEWVKAKGSEVNAGNHKQVEAFNGKRIDGLFAAATGEMDGIENLLFAHVGISIRAWQRMSMLGGSVISSLGDPLIQASRLEANGMNFSAMAADQFGSILTNSGDAQNTAGSLAFGYETITRDIASKFDGGEDVAGWLGKAQHTFFYMAGNNFWESARERAFVHALSMHHYLSRNKTFGNLAADTRASLVSAGIGDREWDLIRKYGAVDLGEGRGVINADTVRNGLTDQDMKDYVGQQKLSASAIEREKLKIDGLWRSYLADQVGWALLKPGIREKAYQSAYQKGAVRGTAAGELFRQLFLFKGYPAQYMQRILGSFTEEDKMHRIAGSVLTGQGRNLRMAKLIGGLMVVGAGVVYLKDIFKNKTPRDPTDPRMLAAAFMQSGGAGIYGDFLFSLQDRHGNSPLLTAMGPSAGDVESLLEIIAKTGGGAYDAMTEGDWDRMKQAGDKTFWFAKQNTPFANIWYSRAAMDYLIWHNMIEQMNPGAMRREQLKMQEDTGQDFLVEPMALQ